MALEVVVELVGRVARAVFGSRNERLIRDYTEKVAAINPLEAEMQALSDEAIQAKTAEFRRRHADGESLDDLLVEAFAVAREAAKRTVWLGVEEAPEDHHPEVQQRIRQAMRGEASLIDSSTGNPIDLHGLYGMRPYDVQLIGGMVLHEGKIAEMVTGEGKTLVAALAVYLNALSGRSVHVVSTNDYLVRVGRLWNLPIFRRLGLTVGAIQAEMESTQRQAEYACDITYGTNNEFGFDYLRDNMKTRRAEQVQGELAYAVVDECDSVLIDEARTPLIISGPAFESTEKYAKADAVARQLRGPRSGYPEDMLPEKDGDPEADFVIRHKEHQCPLTEKGTRRAEELVGAGSFYVAGNMDWPHLIDQALRAHHLYRLDKQYVVRGDEVIIVDDFTGRLMPGRQWSDGLHQAVEAKEQIRIKEETQTLATITLQNYFRMYDKLAGMTGTAMTEAGEFDKIYGLETVAIPTNRPLSRTGHADLIYRTEKEKYAAIVEEIKAYYDSGRPVLVGTTSVENSERLSRMLERTYGIAHEVLNAKYHEKEAQIVAVAGHRHVGPDGKEKGNVTIATNMAGRGTDIKLGLGVVYDTCFGPWDLAKQQIPSDFGHKCCVGCTEYDGGEMVSLGRRIVKALAAGLACAPVAAAIGYLLHTYSPDSAALVYGAPIAFVGAVVLAVAAYLSKHKVIREPCAHCFKPKVDPSFPKRGRTECREDPPCGLHVVGTERHEARRIDNQLRGRTGRQGDPGSSRFFLSLEDDLMRIFARDWVSGALQKLGMEEGMALEHKWLSRGIENAQKKVEERNFNIRKHLLDYDEVMDRQRNIFYGRRQNILEADDLRNFVWDLLTESVQAASDSYLSETYSRETVAEWAARNLGLQLDADELEGKSADALPDFLKRQAVQAAREAVAQTLGEFIPDDLDADEDDYDGEPPIKADYAALARWAQAFLGVEVAESDLRRATPDEIAEMLCAAAAERIEATDAAPVQEFLRREFRLGALADWANRKLDLGITASDLADLDRDAAETFLLDHLERLYAEKERSYPIEYAIEEYLSPQIGHGNQDFDGLAEWASRHYLAHVRVKDIRHRSPLAVRDELLGIAREFEASDRLRRTVEAGVREHVPADALDEEANWQPLAQWAGERLALEITPRGFIEALREPPPAAKDAEADEEPTPLAPDQIIADFLLARARSDRRSRMTELERYLLLQVHDTSWKDHLHEMDRLRSGTGSGLWVERRGRREFGQGMVRGQQVQPILLFKQEGLQHFEQMLDGAGEKFTDLFFKARWVRQDALDRIWAGQSSQHAVAESVYEAQRQAALDMSRQSQMAREGAVKTIIRETPKVGRNDPCPCGSGKKYKKCCGRRS